MQTAHIIGANESPVRNFGTFTRGEAKLAKRFSYRGLRVHRDDNGLSDDVIREIAPSVFATEARDDRSARYSFLDTAGFMSGMRDNGFLPVHVAQSGVRARKDETPDRLAHRQEHTMHFLRFRYQGAMSAALQALAREGEHFEVVIINSHGGESGWQILPGLFRGVCQNGLISGNSLADIRIRHSGNAVDKVLEGAHQILKLRDGVAEERDTFAHLQLTSGEQTAFARAAVALRFHDNITEGRPVPVRTEQFLEPLRNEDAAISNTLWGTLNIVQEHAIKGGDRKQVNPRKREHTRPVNAQNTATALNRALWVLAQEMAALRAG